MYDGGTHNNICTSKKEMCCEMSGAHTGDDTKITSIECVDIVKIRVYRSWELFFFFFPHKYHFSKRI